MVGAYEDPHGIYDREGGKWRILLCEHAKKYLTSIWENKDWDRFY